MARILFINHTANISGPTHSLMMLLVHLRSRHLVSVLLPDDGPLHDWLADEGIPAFYVPARGLRSVWKCAEIIRRERVDLVYGNNPSSYARNALVAARLSGRPFIWHFRGIKWHWGWRKGMYIRLASRAVAVSRASAQSLARFYPLKKIRIVYNGVELSAFGTNRLQGRQYVVEQTGVPANARVLISVSHLNPRKGQEEALTVMHHLAAKHGDVHLLIAGSLDRDPMYTARVREKMQELALDGRVHLLGLRRDIPQLLAGADLFLHTSRQDAHPRAVIEAMAAGLPVVAFAVGGVSETVTHGENGLLSPVGDCLSLATAVQMLLANPHQAQAFGACGRQRVQERFTAEATAERINHIINELV